MQLNSLRTRSRDSDTEGENTGFRPWKRERVERPSPVCPSAVRSVVVRDREGRGLPITLGAATVKPYSTKYTFTLR